MVLQGVSLLRSVATVRCYAGVGPFSARVPQTRSRSREGRGDTAMKHSTDGILTTHTGSLPRPDDLVGLLEGHDQREARADPGFQARVSSAVKEIVRKQVDSGVAVVNDGEMSKVGYSTYLTDRVTGFSEQSRQFPRQVEAGQF